MRQCFQLQTRRFFGFRFVPVEFDLEAWTVLKKGLNSKMARFSTFIHEMAMCRSFIYKMASAKVFHGILAQLPFIVFKMARVTSFRTTLWPLYSWKVTNWSPAEPSLDHQRRLAVSEPIGGWRLSRAIRRPISTPFKPPFHPHV